MTCLPSSHGVGTVVMKNCPSTQKLEQVNVQQPSGYFLSSIAEFREIVHYLAAVGVWTSVSHTHLAGLGVAELEVLIRELVAID